MSEWTYFAQCDFGGPIKIGSTYCVPHRVQTQSLMMPFNLVTIGEVEGGLFYERFLHAWFRRSQIRGEWFEPTAELWRTAFEARTTGRIHFLPPILHRGHVIEVPDEKSRKYFRLTDEMFAEVMGTTITNIKTLHKQTTTRNFNYMAAIAVLLIRAGEQSQISDWLRPAQERVEKVFTPNDFLDDDSYRERGAA